MTRFDLTPLFRSTIGFDHLSRLMDTAFDTATNDGGYPPYNIEKTADDIALTQHENMLIVKGASKTDNTAEQKNYLHRGIAARSFERRFTLSDHVNVTGAEMVNGLLHVDLLREVPEHKKPRTIQIASGKKPGLIDTVKNLASA
jgi:molecular chaperone IbpA